jgi:hypothetical protein
MKTIKKLSTFAVLALTIMAGCSQDEPLTKSTDNMKSSKLGAITVNSIKTSKSTFESSDLLLGSASSFAVLAGTTVTNAEASVITGDLGVSPGTAITGFQPEPINTIEGPGTVTPGLGLVNGIIYASGPEAVQAQVDATIAYNYLVEQEPNTILGDVYQLDGQTFTPGIYNFPSSANLQVNGTLTLDFQGNNDALFIFQLGSTLVTMTNSNIIAINNGNETECLGSNVFWTVGSSATVDGNSFIGTVIAFTSISMTNTGNESGTTNVSGRMLALGGEVTMVNSIITTCGTGTIITPDPEPNCTWNSETAWSAGTRYVKKGNWATYTSYHGVEKTVILYAGQHINIGNVIFSAPIEGNITISIELNEFGEFQNISENVKIQDYSTAPTKNPKPGRFDYKADASGSTFEMVVPVNSFYGVHIDAKSKVCK